MKSTIYLPTKCKVGFNPRPDTYSGKLGYVIYHDGKVWRKETSWKKWIYTVCDSQEFEAKKRKEYNGRMATIVKSNIDYYNRYPQANVDSPVTIEEAEKLYPYDKYTAQSTYRTISDSSFQPYEFENTPIDGFVINKDAGGVGSGWGWHDRMEKVRVYDPRGFEIEVTISNLLHILTNTNSIKGKGLEGKFIYGWDGQDLVLISEYSPEYEDIQKFSDLKNTKSLSKKELVVGEIYLFDDLKERMYLGQYMTYNNKGVPEVKSMLFIEQKYLGGKINENCVECYTSMNRIKKHTQSGQEHLAAALEHVLQYQKFKPTEFTEVEITKLPEDLYYQKFFIEVKGKKVKVRLDKRYRYSYHNANNYDYHIRIGANNYTYTSEKELFTNHKIWQLKKVLTQQS